MITLTIRTAASGHCLFASEGINDSASWHRWVCNVEFGAVSTRPDPVTRAWDHLEAKWGMASTPNGTVPAPLDPQVPLKDFGRPFRSLIRAWIALRGKTV